MLTEDRRNTLFDELNAKGEEKVSNDLANNVYSGTKKTLVESWLSRRDIENFRNDQKITHKLAEEANKLAKFSNYPAWAAVVISIIAIITSLLL